MPQIIPIKNLKNTAEMSDLCHESTEPIYITKNGYGDMVIMSMELYERKMKQMDKYCNTPFCDKVSQTKRVIIFSIFFHIDLVYNGNRVFTG